MGADERVHELDVAAVRVRELGREGLVAAGEFEEGSRGGQAEEAAELVVAWDAALAVAEEVDGAHVAVEAVRGGEVLEEAGVVGVGDCARVVDAEGVEGVCEGEAVVEDLLGFGEGGFFDGHGGLVGSGLGREEGDAVGDEGVHSVY